MPGRSPQSPRKIAFEDLPKFLREKIQFPADQEQSACWIWTGRIQAARQKRNLYRGGEHPELRENTHRYGRERPTPRATHHFTGKDIDAHRLVFSFATCVAVEDLPRLNRCGNDACVSPYCTEASRPLTTAERKRGKPEAQPEPEIEAETLTNDDLMALLKSKRPMASPEPEALSLAEEELGLPAGSIPWKLYLEYCVWDAENPDNDDY